MLFRVAVQTFDGEWHAKSLLGELRLRDCRKMAGELWRTGEYAYVAILNSKGWRRQWFGDQVKAEAQSPDWHR